MWGAYFPPPNMRYSVRLLVWTIEASSRDEAKKKILELLEKSAEHLVSVEEYHSKQPIWKRIITGK